MHVDALRRTLLDGGSTPPASTIQKESVEKNLRALNLRFYFFENPRMMVLSEVRMITVLSFPRKRESSNFNLLVTPAFAGVTRQGRNALPRPRKRELRL